MCVCVCMCVCLGADIPAENAQSLQEAAGHLLSCSAQSKVLRLLTQTRGIYYVWFTVSCEYRSLFADRLMSS